MLAVLAGLNAASYSQRQKEPETEMFPNRSTYSSGPTGTQAFYSLLSETGRKVERWQEPADALVSKGKATPSTFVMIGPYRRDPTEPEYEALFRWVADGGRLVIIDREPPEKLVQTTAKWSIALKQNNQLGLYGADPSDPKKMIADMPAAKPVQPSIFNLSVNAVQPSQFASSITFERFMYGTGSSQHSIKAPPRRVELIPSRQQAQAKEYPQSNLPAPAARTQRDKMVITTATPAANVQKDAKPDDDGDGDAVNIGAEAPVAHLESNGRNILVDAPFGSGRIVILSDPYIVSNGGISLVDNAQLAVNIVSNGKGIVAFDEYHHGYGGNKNRLFEFFAGTPVIAIFFQGVLIIGLVFYSRSRRFGRAIPTVENDRLSKLEYIRAMAEMQQRTRTYDLAIENIYGEFKRRAVRITGLDNTASRQVLAARIAELTKSDARSIDDLMYKCEDIIAGEPAGKREILEIVIRLRRLEHALGGRKRTSS